MKAIYTPKAQCGLYWLVFHAFICNFYLSKKWSQSNTTLQWRQNTWKMIHDTLVADIYKWKMSLITLKCHEMWNEKMEKIKEQK